jgi:Uma2 family endonuclease
VVAVNPPAARHTVICQNIGQALARQLRLPCRPFWGALGVAQAASERNWREPDLIVTCAPPREDFFTAPRLVVEILSPSTEKDDRTTKLDFYESFPSVEAILLVWQEDRRVRLRERRPDGWVDHDLIGSGTVRLRDLGAELELDEIYADPWAAEAG